MECRSNGRARISKPEVRGAIPRISEVKDIEQLFNFLQKTTEY